MFVSSVLLLALAATGLAQAPPEGYRKVLITSKVNAKFVVVPKARTAGSTTIMFVSGPPGLQRYARANTSQVKPATTSQNSIGISKMEAPRSC